MKLSAKSAAVHSLMLIVSMALLTSCASRTGGIQRAEKTTTSMQNLEKTINETTAQIDATNVSLNEVVKAKESPYLKTAFQTYSDNVSKMEDTGKKFIKHSDQMAARGNDYFEEWQKSGSTYTNPQIQRLSQERRNELRDTFTEVSESSMGAKGQLNQYLAEIKQIRTYLSNDLRPEGIDAIAPITEKAINDGNSVKSSLQPVLAGTERALSEMSQGGAAAGGVPSTDQKY